VFLVPAVAYLLLLGIFPLLFSLFMLFGRWQRGDLSWVGLHNIDRLIHQDRFWNAFKLTIEYVAIVAAVELALGTVIALALQSAIRGKNWFRLLFTLPMLLPPIAVSYTWRMLFEYQRGPVNYFLDALGIEKVRWLAGQHSAMAALIIVDIWQWTPFVALGVLAALESLPADLYEAAVVDGASLGSLLRDITFPLLAPYMVALIALRSIDAFKVVDTVYILTGGGPGTATELLTFHAYVRGYRNFDLGYTAASAWALVIIMTIVFFVFLRVVRRQEQEA
jgi:multiple sugar transport system permease protein